MYEGFVCLQRPLTYWVVQYASLLLGVGTIGCHLAIVKLDDGVRHIFFRSYLLDGLL